VSLDVAAWLTAAKPAPAPRRRGCVEATAEGHPWAWTNRAACGDADPAIFFPDLTEPYPRDVLDAARDICSRCPVHAECHAHALDAETEGIWAGTTPRDRRRIRKSLGLADLSKVDPEGSDHAAGIAPPLWELDVNRSAREVAAAAGVSTRTVVRHRVARRAQ
jgi:WhiB family redox-sensing transcriptional regulator